MSNLFKILEELNEDNNDEVRKVEKHLIPGKLYSISEKKENPQLYGFQIIGFYVRIKNEPFQMHEKLVDELMLTFYTKDGMFSIRNPQIYNISLYERNEERM